MEEQYEKLNQFDRDVSGLMHDNNIHSKPTTLQEVSTLRVQTFTIQTIRVEAGDYVSIQMMDGAGSQRILLPPRVVDTMVRQRDALTAQARSSRAKRVMKERMAAGFVPTFAKKKKRS